MNLNQPSLAAALVVAGMLSSACASAEDFSVTSATLLYTSKSKADPVLGTGTSDEKLTPFRAALQDRRQRLLPHCADRDGKVDLLRRRA